jgi:hypothetical protein
MTSELMRATVAERQGDAREGGAERSGRQSCDHGNTNRQRGRQWAASVLANAKPEAHQDTAGRAGWRAAKVQALTRGGLGAERRRGVSRGHSKQDRSRGLEEARLNDETGTLRPLKGQRNQQQRSTVPCAAGPKFLGFTLTAALRDRHRACQPGPL